MTDFAYAYRNIDRDRLDQIIPDISHELGRARGRTFAFAMLMLGEAWLGDHGNKYLYIGENYPHTHDVMRGMADLFQEDGFDIRVKPEIWQIQVLQPNQVFFFSPAEQHSFEKMRGRTFAEAFIDLTWEKEQEVAVFLNNVVRYAVRRGE